MGVFTKSLVASHISVFGLAVLLVASCASPSSPSSSPAASSSTYTVTYNGNGSTSGSVPVDKNTYSSGSTVTVFGNTGSLAKTGYTFVGWNTNADGSGITYPSGVTFTIGSANVSLFALWTQSPTFTVTYSGNGFSLGTVPLDGNNYIAGMKVTVLGNTGGLTKTGYLFSGWNTQANGQGVSYSGGATFSMPSSNVVLYAIWLPTFTVTYIGNGSTSGSVPVDSNLYIQGATVTALANTENLAKTGYTFVGWNTAANGSGTAQLVGSTFVMGTSNVTLYAQWTNAPTYTVSYDGNGSISGTVPFDSNNYLSGTTVTVLGNTGNLSLSGYSFSGWNTLANGNGTGYSSTSTLSMGSSNLTLYAVWTNQTTGTVTITTPGTFSISITGLNSLHFGTQYSFSSTYTGSPVTYQWFLDGSPIAGATSSTLTITPTVSTFTYGSNILSLTIVDSNGVTYSGTFACNVTN